MIQAIPSPSPALPRGPRAFTTYPRALPPSHGDDSHLLSRIASPADVKALAPNELAELCREIRATLLAYGHQHGGHIGSNLGMVEATVALHRVFDSPRDRIVFDVSHQSYVHKMLTGRAAAYLDPTVSAR